MKTGKKVLTFGVYDILHIGHVLLFEHAKEYGDELIVAVQASEKILKYKPTTQIMYPTEQRMYMVGSIRYVDSVISYEDVDVDIKNIDFDLFAKGPDQTHAGFQRATEWCIANDKEVVVIPRTEGISSSLLRERIKKEDKDER